MDDVGVDQQLDVGGVKHGFGGKGQQVLPSQNNCLDLRMQGGEFAVDGLPDHFKVHLVVAVRNAIAHGIHDLPWNVAVLSGKYWVYPLDIVGCFANDLDVPCHGILDELTGEEGHFVHVRDVFLDALDRLKNMTEVVGYTQ
jgi:hypothetical protein